MTTRLFGSWSYPERPVLGPVGLNKFSDFDDPVLMKDVHEQHERVHENQEKQGYRFPLPATPEWGRHPVRLWTASMSPSITRYWLDHESGRQYTPEKTVADAAHSLDSHLNNSPALGERVFAYSGIAYRFGQVLNGIKPGNPFSNPAPIALSLSPGIAFKRSNKNILSLELPPGSRPGIYAGKVGSMYEHEHELVLRRNSPLVLQSKHVHTLHPEEGNETHTVFHFKYVE